jgi:predicted S18 family serine protease
MRTLSKITAAALLALSVLVFAPVPSAADVKMIGKVTAIKVAADGKSAVATLTNTKGGGAVTVTVTDKATLDMFAAKRISAGDEVRLSYDDAGGTNPSKTFKKAAGC